MNAIDLHGVQAGYDQIAVLHEIGLQIPVGARVAVIGPSGGGKSTLLHVLAGSLVPSRGRLRILDTDPATLSTAARRRFRRRIAVVPQHLDLIDDLRVLHNVNAGQLGAWPWWRSLWSLLVPQNRAQAIDLLRRVGIPDLVDRRTGNCSGGERQRVAIARALAQEPQLLLTDEPTAHVDPHRSEQILDLLAGLSSEAGLTWICNLHDIGFARSHFDLVVGLRAGRIVFCLPAGDCSDADMATAYGAERAGASA